MKTENKHIYFCYRLGDGWSQHGLKPKLNLVAELVPQSAESTISPITVNNDVTASDELTDSNERTESRITIDANIVDADSDNNKTTKTDDDLTDNRADSCSKYARKATPVESLADFLPPNSFYYNGKYSYIFPGAEIYLSENEDDDDDDNSADSDSDDSEGSTILCKQYELDATELCTDSTETTTTTTTVKTHRPSYDAITETTTTTQTTVVMAAQMTTSNENSTVTANALPLDAEAMMVLPKNELVNNSCSNRSSRNCSSNSDLNNDLVKKLPMDVVDDVDDDICPDAVDSPRFKRTSVESVDSLNNSDSDDHVVAQKRCKY